MDEHPTPRESSGARAKPWTLAEAVAALSRKDVHVKLFGAVRLLQAAQPDKELLGYATSPDREPVRIDQSLLMGFTALEVAKVASNVAEDGAADDAARHKPGATTCRAVVSQFAVGLLGPNGPMPSVWTEHAYRLERGMDHPHLPESVRTSFMAFLNLLQRRQLAFFYRAWSDAQAVVAMDSIAGSPRPHLIADRLRALGGFGHAELAERDSIEPEFKLAFAAVLSRRVRSPQALGGMLTQQVDAPVRIEEFSSCWLDIPSGEQTALGLAHSGLGEGAVVGAHVLDANARFDVIVGPVGLQAYLDLLPGGALLRKIRDLVALYAGPEAQWRLRPVLRAPDVPRLEIGSACASLGLSSWLGHCSTTVDAQDLALPMAPDFQPQ